MIDNSMKDSLNSESGLIRYLTAKTHRARKKKGYWECPVCGSTDGLHVKPGGGWDCFALKHITYGYTKGDVFMLHAQIHGLDCKKDFPQIIKEVAEIEGVNLIETAPPAAKPAKERKEDPGRKERIKIYASQIKGSIAERYLHERGFSDDIISRFSLGYNPKRYVWQTNKCYEALSIPYPGLDYYTERLLNPDEEVGKYQNQTGKAPAFVIKDSPSSVFVLTEGQLDALSNFQAGAMNVIAAKDAEKIEKLLESIRITGVIIEADNDKPGKDGVRPGEALANAMKSFFDERGIKSVIVYPPDPYKDSNDILREKPELLSQLLEEWTKILSEAPEPEAPEPKKEAPAGALESFNVGSYLSENIFDKDIEYFSKYKDRKTGFENLDRYLTLYPGVACLGGASSLGKTTFAVNVADNLLGQGEHVIYFSLEQLPIELVTKSLARQVKEIDPFSPIKNIDIKNGASSFVLEEVKKEYAEFAKNYQIVQGDFHLTAKAIVEHVEAYIKKTGVRPVVVIDYLQLIAPPEGFKGGQREIVDENLKAIKDLSKRNELFILLISSFNRTSYKEPVSMESFKESGGIEYTCDYIWGMQLSILEDPRFFSTTGRFGGEKDTNNDKKSKALDEAIGKNPKEVELVVLKNRNGKQRFKSFFVYYMEYDAFEVDKVSKFEQFVKKGGATQNNALEGLTGMRAI